MEAWSESLREANKRKPSRGRELTIPEGPSLRTASRSTSRSISRCRSAESSVCRERCGDTPSSSVCSSVTSRGLSTSLSRRSVVKLTVPEGPTLATQARSLSRRRRHAGVASAEESRPRQLKTSCKKPEQPEVHELKRLQQQLEVLTHRWQQAELTRQPSQHALQDQLLLILQQQEKLLQQQESIQKVEQEPSQKSPPDRQEGEKEEEEPLHREEEETGSNEKETATDGASTEQRSAMKEDEEQQKTGDEPLAADASDISSLLTYLPRPGFQAASPSSRAERARQQALQSLEEAQAVDRERLFCFRAA